MAHIRTQAEAIRATHPIYCEKTRNLFRSTFQILERAKGIEPSYAAWEAAVLPLNYARLSLSLSP
jgi:hypothetical protein